MAREPYLVQVAFAMDNNDPADTVINTWHFGVEPSVTTPWTTIEPMLNTFYQAFDQFMSSRARGRAPTTKWYFLNDPKPRTPLHEGSLSGSIAGGSDDGAPELAVVLSYHALYQSGISKARKRNRVYLGPWVKAACDNSGLVDSALQAAIVGAAGTFLTTMAAQSDMDWIAYSQVTGGGTEVVGGWVDNAWDIQRRRGIRPTVRSTFGTG